ncbi:MAG: hypothetical protein PHS31_03975 [Victivallaceae bacterium]|nr:hypothetical protein [Victivallaceae bacterium]MDD4181276.1 hypothetical protein [Victivallaceae bacterium]
MTGFENSNLSSKLARALCARELETLVMNNICNKYDREIGGVPWDEKI